MGPTTWDAEEWRPSVRGGPATRCNPFCFALFPRTSHFFCAARRWLHSLRTDWTPRLAYLVLSFLGHGGASSQWVQIPRQTGSRRTNGLPSPLPLARRSVLCLDFQRVPAVCAAGQPPLHLPGDGELVHRQGGALRRWQLHLRGEQHRHPGEGAQLPDAAAPQE